MCLDLQRGGGTCGYLYLSLSLCLSLSHTMVHGTAPNITGLLSQGPAPQKNARRFDKQLCWSAVLLLLGPPK